MKIETENGTELTTHKVTSNRDQNEDTDTKNKTTPLDRGVLNTISEFVIKVFKFFTVEPFLLCYILPGVIASTAVYKLNMEKACRADLGYTEEVCANAILGNVAENITVEALNKAQVLVAEMTAWRQPLQSGIPAIMILFVGAWSDRTGNRKTLMLVPLIGDIITSVLLLLATYYFLEWPLWVTGLIEALPSALSGGISIALMGSYSYIADVTSVDSRTFRIGIVAVIVTLGIPIGASISGILTKAVGYYGIFGIGLGIYIIGFIHTYCRVHDVKKVNTEGTFISKVIEFFHPRNVWDTLSLLIMARGRRLAQISLVIWAHIIIMGPVFGEGGLLYLYTLKKYSMDLTEFSLFSAFTTLMGLAGTTIAVTIFSKKLKMHDALLGIIATACKVASSFVYALAPTKPWLYTAPAVDFFGNSGVTAIRSLGTKIVNPNEVGKMCSLIGFIEALIPVVYTPIYSKVYAKTLKTFPGAFYLLGGIMTIPDFLVFIVSVPGYAGSLSAALPGGGGAAWERLGAELVLTALVAAAYFAAMERRWTGAAPALLGAAYCAASLVSMPSLNPARSLGPSFVLSRWDSHWVCWVGGLGGGVACGLLHEWGSRRPRTNSRASSPRDLDELDKPTFPTHHYRHAPTYCSASAPRPDNAEPLYSGTKSLYCRSPPPARHTLHRSQSVYSKSSSTATGGPLMSAQSLLLRPPLATTHSHTLTHNQNTHNAQRDPAYGASTNIRPGPAGAAVQERRESVYSGSTRRGPLSSDDSAYGTYTRAPYRTPPAPLAHAHPPEHY